MVRLLRRHRQPRGGGGRLQLRKTQPSPMDRHHIKKIKEEETKHLPPPLRPRAAISCNNGGHGKKKNKTSTQGPDAHHRATRWRRGRRGRGGKSKPLGRNSLRGQNPITVERNCVRGEGRGLASAANCHGYEREPTGGAWFSARE